MEEKKTILIINKFCPLHPKAGGAEKNLLEIFSRIGAQHNVILLAGRFPGAAEEEILKNIHIYRIGAPHSENVIRIHLLLPFALRSYLKRFTPDILIEDMSVLPFFTPLLYSKRKKAVMVHGLNGRYFFTSQRFPFSLFGYCAEKLFFMFYRNETVITVSEWVREKLIRRGFRNVHTILNGVDDTFLKVEKKYAPRPSVLFLGRLEGRKGVGLLLRTFPFVETKIPSVRYVIAGRRFYFGEPRRLRKILDYFGNRYSKDQIEFTGYVSEEKKREFLATTWLLAMPSLTEGYGIVALEANSTGTFVIANDTEGLREAVKRGKTGVLVNCRSVQEFSEKIVEWLSIKKLREREEECRAWGKTHSWEKAADEVIKVIHNIIEARPR